MSEPRDIGTENVAEELRHSCWEGFSTAHSSPGLRQVVSLLVHQPSEVLVPVDSFATSTTVTHICDAKSETNKLPSEKYPFADAKDILLHLQLTITIFRLKN